MLRLTPRPLGASPILKDEASEAAWAHPLRVLVADSHGFALRVAAPVEVRAR